MRLLKNLMLGFVFLLIGLSVFVLALIPISIYESPGDLLPFDNSQTLVVDNIHILDVNSGEIAMNRQLTLKSGLIEAIRPAGSTPAIEHSFINGNGGYVVPGLFDMHVHIHDRKYLALNLAYGVTSVRNLRGLPMHLRWRDELEQGQWLGSNLYTSSPVLDGEKYAHILQEVVTSPDILRQPWLPSII